MKFDGLIIKKIFNSFLYQNSKFNRNEIVNSIFIRTLNSAIFLSSMEIIDEINTSQTYIEQTEQMSVFTLTVDNSCFLNCVSKDPAHLDGGAIHVVISFYTIEITNTIFSKCSTAGNGGSIYSIGQVISVDSTIFNDCKSDECGSAIHFQNNGYAKSTFNQVLFINNVAGKCLVVDIDIEINECSYLNFSANKNNLHNSLSNVDQLCCIYSFWNLKIHSIFF